MNKCTYLLSALLLSAFTLQAAEDIKVMQFLHTGALTGLLFTYTSKEPGPETSKVPLV